jgi:hypothetical protein
MAHKSKRARLLRQLRAMRAEERRLHRAIELVRRGSARRRRTR